MEVEKDNVEEGEDEDKENKENEMGKSEDEYIPVSRKSRQKPFNQNELNDFIRDIGVAKDIAEFMAAELVRRKLVRPGTKSSIYRKREIEIPEILYLR